MMSSVAIFSGLYCRATSIIDSVCSRAGLTRFTDDDFVREAEQATGMAREKLLRALEGKIPVHNSFTREHEKAICHLRHAVAKVLVGDPVLIDGFCAHLIHPTVRHVLSVCLIADLGSRVKAAQESGGAGVTDPPRTIRSADERAALWVASVRGAADPWNGALYDVLIPTDKVSHEEAVELITASLGRGTVRRTHSSEQAALDYLVAARTGSVLAQKGHLVGIECVEGHVTLTINKHVLMLRRLERELQEIASAVEGVERVTTQVGRDFYKTDIYRDVEFEKPSRVLLVDDEREFVQTLSERLEMRDVGSAVAYDGESALRMVEHDEPEVIILDLRMPGIDGIEVLRRVKKSHPAIEVIILTGHGSDADRRVCLELGAFAYLQKPVDIDVLSETLRKANEKASESTHAKTSGGDSPR
jgi:CheY-like chemotaxis protein